MIADPMSNQNQNRSQSRRPIQNIAWPKSIDPKTEQVPIISPSATPLLSEGFSAKPRRRSRTRSRGRSSQDFAGKTKVTLYPTNAAPSANESSPHESPVSSTPQPTALTSPPPVPPIHANFAFLQAPRIFPSPEPGTIYHGRPPKTPGPERAPWGLFQPLAGPDAYDPLLASPPITPPPLPGKLFRNNTAGGSGGERIAARKVMMRQLGRRLKEAEAEQTSGGEDSQPATTARRKQRAIQRLPSTRSTVVESRTLPSHYWVPQVTQDGQQIYYVNTQTGQHYIRDLPIDAEGDLSEVDFHASSSTVVDGRESPSAASPTTPLSPSAAADHGHGQASPIPRSTYNGRSDRPPRIASPRPPHAPGVLLSTSSESADASAPAYLSVSSQEQQEVFPTSPFATPLREKQGSDEEEDARTDHETARRSPWNDAYDREISWVAEIVPERIPVHDDDDYDDPDDMDEPRNPSVARHHPDHDEHEHEYDDDSLPRAFHSKNLVVDIEASPEAPKHSQIPPSPSSAIVLPRHLSNDSRIFPAHLSLSSPSPPQLPSPNTEYLEWEESLRVIVPDTKPKKNGESSQSRWDKVKNAIARLGPRNNSIKERANNTDSSTRMENGASLTGASKPDKELRSSYFSSSSGAVSPVPPASSGTLQKYGGDAKLFPFPGIKRLEEERRTRGGGGLSLNASSPDIALPPTLDEFSAISSGSASSRTPHASPEVPRDRKLSRRASDTHLFQKFNSANTPPALSSQSTSPSLDPTSPSTSNLDRLAGTSPTNREGVKTWLRAKNLFPSQSSQPSFSGLQQPVSAPVVITQSGSTDESRNLPDLLDGRKERRVNWEDIWTPTTTNGSAAQSRQTQNVPEPESSTRELPSAGSLTLETPARGRSSFSEERIITSKGDAQSVMYPTRFISPTPDPNLSATPNPTPSLDGYASQSSPSSSSSERFLEPTTSRTPEEMILERLEPADVTRVT
ncbi:hypothetical protein F5148DRAFT_903024 [Russula earlei]|uniref:Uncharacterized protein n=1 Tax=Russula earlei TaxID=71964 RepID=A0ACC0ULG6_9AGAM|nr:hypothetical protein F5148DRAFT_903024 [Russula earlei]